MNYIVESVCIAAKKAEVLLWVDKYKPKVMREIVGQGGEKSNAKKLLKWLLNWNDNHLGVKKPKGKGGIVVTRIMLLSSYVSIS